MIRLTFTNCKWGTDALDEADGVQINLLDEESQIMVHVPFSGEALPGLAFELVSGMTPEQRDALEVLLRDGVETPEPVAAAPVEVPVAPPAPEDNGGKKKDEAEQKPNPFLKK